MEVSKVDPVEKKLAQYKQKKLNLLAGWKTDNQNKSLTLDLSE
jgi:hypothetical protein